MSDLVIVGGGVIGLSVARDAAARGLDVSVLDKGRPGREATWAAAGMLSPLSEASGNGPFLDFALASLRLYPNWIASLGEVSDIDVEYRKSGKIRLALSERARERLEARKGWASERGLSARWLEPEELRREEPELSLSIQGGLLLEEDFRIDSRRLADALIEAARSAGVRISAGVKIDSLLVKNGRATGVLTSEGDTISSERVLIAAGAWSGQIQGLPRPLSITPILGQMLALQAGGGPSERVLESEEVYLIPRDDGRILVGATVEDVGFRSGITAAGIRSLLEGALRLLPALGSAPITELWSGLRPGSPDGHPLLGPDPEVDGLYHATGHFRNGILLAPLSGTAMGALLAGEDGPGIPQEFSPARFDAGSTLEPMV